ncbi:MAG: DUF4389 domain-containing protein [Gammaproteobacteria bacterium]|nr:DUF4389 domain-containing protein [Gammaproteobacteria bacterium]
MTDHPSKEELKKNVQTRSTWVRLLYMVLFAIFFWVAEVVLVVMVFFQFLHKLLLGDTNENLLKFTSSLSLYFYKVIQFLTFNSEDMPFPFDDWPKPEIKTSKPRTKKAAGG